MKIERAKLELVSRHILGQRDVVVVVNKARVLVVKRDVVVALPLATLRSDARHNLNLAVRHFVHMLALAGAVGRVEHERLHKRHIVLTAIPGDTV